MRGLMQRQPLLISSILTFAARHHGGGEVVSNAGRRRPATATPTAEVEPAPAASPACSSAGRAPARPGRHAGLEQLPPPRALLRRLRHGRGLPHHQPAPVRRRSSPTSSTTPRTGSCSPIPPSPRWSSASSAALRTGRARSSSWPTGAHMPELPCPPASTCSATRTLMAAADEDYAWPALRRGDGLRALLHLGHDRQPKGVLYSHRSTVLHAYGVQPAGHVRPPRRRPGAARRRPCSTSTPGASPTPPPWSAPRWSCPAASSTAPACTADERGARDHAAGVPTVWLGLLQHLRADRHPARRRLQRVCIGGSACPRS